MESFFHVDPVNLVLLVVGLIAAWVTLRNSTQQNTLWIQKHEKSCDEFRKDTATILTKLENTTSILTTLTQSHHEHLKTLDDDIREVRRKP